MSVKEVVEIYKKKTVFNFMKLMTQLCAQRNHKIIAINNHVYGKAEKK